MSKLLKSKILLGVMIVAVMVVGVAVLASSASADCSLATTLKQGMKGTEVSCLQAKLSVTPATGYFGTITKAAVMAYQANHSLKADGVVGALTRAALNSGTTVTPPTTTDLCPNGMTLASNCQTAPTTTTTVTLCPNGMTLASNCQTAPTNTVPTNGTAGDITVTSTSVDVETDISEGTSQKVLGFKAEATGSDITVTNVKVVMQNVNPSTSSTRLERYISEADVYMGSTKVGSVLASDFTKDGTTYSANIATNAVVKKGSANKATFYVVLVALPNIDSTDLGHDDWTIGVGNLAGTSDGIRFVDGTGMVLTTNASAALKADNLDFQSLASSGDVKITVSKASSSPAAQNVEVSDTGSTSNVDMLDFKIKATGTDITFDEMDFTLTSSGATPTEIASELSLYEGTNRLGEITTLGASGSTTNTITLDDDLVIKAGETRTFKVVAKINKIAVGNFTQGDSLKVDLSATPFAGIHEDANGDTVTNITGAALGEYQAFYSQGLNASDFTSSFTTTSDGGVVKKETYTISYKLTAFGETYYVPKTVVRGTATTEGLGYLVETSAGTTALAAAVTSSQSSLTSSANTVGGYFEIPDGETKTFTVTIELTPTASTGTAGYYHVQLATAGYDTDQSGSPTYYSFAPAQNFETSDSKID